MKPSEAYQMYMALKMHFTTERYDFFKYDGKVNIGNFDERKDRWRYIQLAKNYNTSNLMQFYVANFLEKPKQWIGGMTKDVYLAWKRKMINLEDTYVKQLKLLMIHVDEHPQELFMVPDDGHPILLTEHLAGIVSLETLVILDSLMGFTKSFDKRLDDPIWEEVSFMLRKYKPFIALNEERLKALTKSAFGI